METWRVQKNVISASVMVWLVPTLGPHSLGLNFTASDLLVLTFFKVVHRKALTVALLYTPVLGNCVSI